MKSEMFMEILTLYGARAPQSLRSAVSTLKMLTLPPQGRLILFIVCISIVFYILQKTPLLSLVYLHFLVWFGFSAWIRRVCIQMNNDHFECRLLTNTKQKQMLKTDVIKH